MASATTAVGGFEFSPAAADKIRAILDGDPASVTPVLQKLVANYVRRQYESEIAGCGNAQEIQRLAEALRSVVQCIKKATPSLQQQLHAQTLGDMIAGTSQWQHLVVLSKHAAESAHRLKPRRGAPRKIERDRLCLEVTLVLHLRGGLKVPTSRVGEIARIMKIVLHEVRDQPTDVFLLVKRCAQFMRERTSDELREVLEQARRFDVSPAAAAWVEWTAERFAVRKSQVQ